MLRSSATLLTSNRPPADWYVTFPDPSVGGAILDRMVSSTIKIITTSGKSYRREVVGVPQTSESPTDQTYPCIAAATLATCRPRQPHCPQVAVGHLHDP